MSTLPQRAAPSQPQHGSQWPALTSTLDRTDRPAQVRAIQRWHQRDVLCTLDQSIAQHDHYPLIACNDQARAFAPSRGAPRPAA